MDAPVSTTKPRWSRRKKWATALAVLVLVAVAAAWLSRPPPAPAAVPTGTTMRAVVYHEYGPPDVLRIERVDPLQPKDDQVLIRVRAAGANPLDWHYVRGTPYLLRLDAGLRRPTNPRVGADLAGEVVAVGRNVTQFKVGDAVFGTGGGSFAEYVRASQRRLAPKPASLSFEDAAALPIAAVTALQALRDHGRVQPGQKVLINGASGGVGTYAVQIAKAMGAEVTAVCSTRNVALVQELGADHVVDYTKEDFTRAAQRYDLVIDNVGNHSQTAYRRVLTDAGTYVGIGGGGPAENRWGAGFVWGFLQARLLSGVTNQRFVVMLAEVTRDDLLALAKMTEAGTVRSVIDRTYPLEQAADALRYLESGRARGKVVLTVAPGT